MNYTIRDYKKDDYASLIDLWQKTGLNTPGRGDDREVISHTLSMGAKLFVLTVENGTVAGSAWITSDGRRLYLHHFGILPEYQGLGLSKKLLKRTLEFAKEKAMQIKLEVYKENEIAKKLYEKAGFKYLGDYEVYIIRDIQEFKP